MPLPVIVSTASCFFNKLRLRASSAIFCVLFGSAVYAQVYTGSVAGVVTDPSGAVIPGALITVKDSGKRFIYTATTDEAGRYLVRPLPPSGYRLSIEASGFKTHVQEGLVLSVNQNASMDASLTLGVGAQSVEVTSTTTALDTQDSSTGPELDRNFINEMPLMGRNVFDLAGLAPGIAQTSGGLSMSY